MIHSLFPGKNHHIIFPSREESAQMICRKYQFPETSTIGNIVSTTGGVLIDFGWIRLIGSGNPHFLRDIATWNEELSIDQHSHVLIADDVLGGLFAINLGGLGDERGDIYYFAPDTLSWESLGTNYEGYVNWLNDGNIELFYRGFRWENWKQDIQELSTDDVWHFFPPLMDSSISMDHRSRNILPIKEYYTLYTEKTI